MSRRGYMPDWSIAEMAILREVYPIGGIDAAVAMLPGRSERAIIRRASVNKIKAGCRRKLRARVDVELAVDVFSAAARAGVAARAAPAPAKPVRRRSFEEQLAAVRAGAKLERAWKPPVGAGVATLAGVASGWGH
ncbi:MAG: hypothetical protein E2598_07600 [Sphingobium sp.]|nr:hypothetical protein [Sphingobium sp.]